MSGILQDTSFPASSCCSLDPDHREHILNGGRPGHQEQGGRAYPAAPWLRERSDVKEHILEVLRRKADGTFLWVSLMIPKLEEAGGSPRCRISWTACLEG